MSRGCRNGLRRSNAYKNNATPRSVASVARKWMLSKIQAQKRSNLMHSTRIYKVFLFSEITPHFCIVARSSQDLWVAPLATVVVFFVKHRWINDLSRRKLCCDGLRHFATPARRQWGPPMSASAKFARRLFHDALLAVAGRGGAVNAKTFGRWLLRNRRRMVGGIGSPAPIRLCLVRPQKSCRKSRTCRTASLRTSGT